MMIFCYQYYDTEDFKKLAILNKAIIENSIPLFISRNLNTSTPISMCIQRNSKHSSMEANTEKVCMQDGGISM